MFRFTIRDVPWLTVVVALAMGWWLNHADSTWRLGAVRRHAMALRDSLANAEHNEAIFVSRLANLKDLETDIIEVDWELADKMIP